MIVITVARKPLVGSVVNTVAQYGTGGVNLDACRIEGPKGQGTWGTSNATVRADRMFNGSPGMREYRSAPHAGGRFPANVVLEHLPGCRRIGVSQIKGNRVDTRPEGDGGRDDKTQWRFRPTEATRRGYSDDDGTETVDEWDCRPGCPVKELDRHSGIHTSGVMKHWTDPKPGETATTFLRGHSGPHNQPGGTGGASRFFKQVQEIVWYRAGGACVCPDCNKLYYDHPTDRKFPFLNVLCNGDRVKL